VRRASLVCKASTWQYSIGACVSWKETAGDNLPQSLNWQGVERQAPSSPSRVAVDTIVEKGSDGILTHEGGVGGIRAGFGFLF